MAQTQSLRAGDLDLAFHSRTATIRSIATRGHRLMVGSRGYVAVEDRTTGRFHFRPEDQIPAEPAGDRGAEIAVRQCDPAADLILTQYLAARDRSIEWRVRITTDADRIREIHLHFVIPVFGPASHGFTAHARCPLVPGGDNDHLMVVYGADMFNEESFHCSVLPLVASYDPETDAGLVVIQPVDTPKPRMEYFFVREQPDISLVVRWTHLRLHRARCVEAVMMLAPIRACWRDALRSVHDHYPDYFRVPEPSVFNHEGAMVCGELIPDPELDALVQEQDLAWQEIHANVFAHYGDYAPQTDRWPDWVAGATLKDFDLERLSRTGFRDLRSAITSKPGRLMTRRGLNDYIQTLQGKGVAAYLYTNPVILDLDHVRQFPDSLAESADGTPMFRDYYRNAPMYPAAETSWGRYLDQMTRRALDQFPQIDGFFLDELHWNQFDFAHDDGISARGKRPVAMIGFAVQDAARRICTAAHDRGKAVWANGANTLEVARHIDGFMAECSWEWLGSVLYLGLEKPIVLLMSDRWSLSQLADALGAALFAAAQPGVIHSAQPEPEQVALLKRYRPLFAMLRGRKWILHPHAITCAAPALRTNCFVLPEGDFAVTLSGAGGSDYDFRSADGHGLGLDEPRADGGQSARLRLQWPGLEQTRSARLFLPTEADQPLELEIEREPNGIVLSIPPLEAGIVRLSLSAPPTD